MQRIDAPGAPGISLKLKLKFIFKIIFKIVFRNPGHS